MHEKLNKYLASTSCIKTASGDTAWPLKSIPAVLDVVSDNGWIILGGDILTMEHHFTYDNWYFNPDPLKPLDYNVRSSVEKCTQYLTQYANRNGDNYLILLTISDTYIGGVVSSQY